MSALLRALQGAFLFGRGRVLAAALALALAVPFWWADAVDWPGTPALLRHVGTPAATTRQFVFDTYQHLWPRRRVGQPVVVVEIDEASLRALGQWPWPRSQLARLIDVIASHQPAAIGLDLYMPEPDQTSPAALARNLAESHPELARHLAPLPDHDLVLAQSLRASPSVLGVAGFDFPTMSTDAGVRVAPITADRPGDALRRVPHFPYVLASLPGLQAAARGQAVLSLGTRDVVVRRIPLVTGVAGQLAPSLAMEMLRVAAGDVIRLQADGDGVQGVGVADLQVPTLPTGEIWLHYASEAEPGALDMLRVSAAAMLGVGDLPFDPASMAGRLVLVGLTGLGLSDMRATARGELVPGIDIQAQVLESLLARQWLERPQRLRVLELAILLTGAAAMIAWAPRAVGAGGQRRGRWGWWVFAGSAIVLLVGPALFLAWAWLADPLGIVLAWAIVAASLASSGMLEIERANVRLAGDREKLREAAARVAGELEAARRIQLGALPDPVRVFPGETRFDIAGLVQPAREVGGDLYDFFLVDGGRRLCFLVGDVSGKGIPAGIFMTMTRTLCKSFALREPGGPERVVDALNADLARENSEWMFVTLVLCVIDLVDGRIEIVNAGHEPPWLRRADGTLERLDGPPDSGGPPLCFVDGYAYRSFAAQLQVGDALCLFSDGISEAVNAAGQVYGVPRVGAQTAKWPLDVRAAQALAHVHQDVQAFVGEIDVADDLTLLLVRWWGAGRLSAP